jgi:hypothetical protein
MDTSKNLNHSSEHSKKRKRIFSEKRNIKDQINASIKMEECMQTHIQVIKKVKNLVSTDFRCFYSPRKLREKINAKTAHLTHHTEKTLYKANSSNGNFDNRVIKKLNPLEYSTFSSALINNSSVFSDS